MDGQVWLAFVVGVGNQEESFTDMGSSTRGSGENVPRKIIPECGKIFGHTMQSESNDSGRIFEEYPFGLDFSDDADDVRPQPA
jgi:hypothetical protein